MNKYSLPTPSEIEHTLGLAKPAQRKRWLSRSLMAGLAIALVAGGGYWYFTQRTATTAVAYETAPAIRTDMQITVTATGTVQPTTQVEVGSEMSGIIRNVMVTDNALVKAGETLATLDTVRLQAELARSSALVAAANARLLDAKVTLAQSQSTLKRQSTLRKGGLSTTESFEVAGATKERADASVTAAEADVAVAKADLAIKQTDLEKSNIKSPINGIVLKRSVEPGQTVAASLQAPVLFTLAEDLTRIQVEVQVDEADIGVIKIGQNAQFTVDAYRDRSFPARIESIAYAPETVDGVVTYKATLSASNDDLSLRPGMTATARIVVENITATLAVSNETLRYAPPKVVESQGFSISQMFMPRFPKASRGKSEIGADGMRSIWVLQDGAPAEVKIKTGPSDGKLTAVTAGDLAEGAAVIIASKTAQK